MNGEQKLRAFYESCFPKTVTRVNDRTWHFLGYGHSNCVGILGEHSWILIDTLDSDTRAARMYEKLRAIRDVPVGTIIFTHGHPDHRGGSGAFRAMSPEVIAFTPVKPALKYYERIDSALRARGRLQFGYDQTDEEAICQGIGPREGHAQGDGKYDFLPPTTVYGQESVHRTIDGVRLELTRAPGETDDQILGYLPDDKVICTGDNYYGVFPNLYAIRGTQYRDIAQWVDSLRKILSYDADALLPGHTRALLGRALIQEQVGTFADAIEAVLFDTLDCIDRGLTLSEAVESVHLRREYEEKPYLGEYYGTVEWAVRSIYTGYVGWFDGDPARLLPLSDREFNAALLELIGPERLRGKIEDCLEKEEYQLALQLLAIENDPKERRKALLGRARQMTSANARHYLMGSAAQENAGTDAK